VKVPKIIHQTWKTKEIPQELLFCVESWKKLNPEWEYILWTDEAMDSFVKKNFPEMHEVYAAYPHGVFRSDLFRLLVVYQRGGVYVDLDVECIKSLDSLFEKYIKEAELTFTYEAPLQSKVLYGLPPQAHAFFLAAIPGHEILNKIVKTIVAKGAHHKLENVIWVTGPNAITECLQNMPLDSKVLILDHRVTAPVVDITNVGLPLRLRRESLRMLLRKEFYVETSMVHYWWHGYSPGADSALSLSPTELERRFKDSKNPVYCLMNDWCSRREQIAASVKKKSRVLHFILSRIFRLLIRTTEQVRFLLFWRELLKQLTPYEVRGFEEKIRLGNLSDGGYVIPLRILTSVEVVYTYGVADDISFENDLARLKDVPFRFYDHTVTRLPEEKENFFFNRQGLAEKKYGPFDTFQNHLSQNGDAGKKILLKMDIEGKEWEVMGPIVARFSDNIVAIILEVHDLHLSEKFPEYRKVLRAITSKFTLVHIHGNNFSKVVRSGKQWIPEVCELTFIRNKFIKGKKVMAQALPSELDYPNSKKEKDILLNFWL